MLHQKQTSLICIYPSGIDTDPITYPVDTCRRRTLIPMISHTPHEWNTSQALCLVTHTYISKPREIQTKKEYRNILSVIYRDTYSITIYSKRCWSRISTYCFASILPSSCKYSYSIPAYAALYHHGFLLHTSLWEVLSCLILIHSSFLHILFPI